MILHQIKQNKKHRNALRCLIFCLAGDERVELPLTVLESGIKPVLTCRKMLKHLLSEDLSTLLNINLLCFLGTIRADSPQIVP